MQKNLNPRSKKVRLKKIPRALRTAKDINGRTKKRPERTHKKAGWSEGVGLGLAQGRESQSRRRNGLRKRLIELAPILGNAVKDNGKLL